MNSKQAKKTAFYRSEPVVTYNHPLDEAYLNLCAAIIRQAIVEIDDEYKERHRWRGEYTREEYDKLVRAGDAKIRSIHKFFLSTRFENFNLDIDGDVVFDNAVERIERKYCGVVDPHDLVFIHNGSMEYRFMNLRSARRMIGCGGDKLIRLILGDLKEVNGWQLKSNSKPRLRSG